MAFIQGAENAWDTGTVRLRNTKGKCGEGENKKPRIMRGLCPSDERNSLADYLGCHEEARASAWEAWSAELNPADWDAAQCWLDVEFIEPCPEHQP